MWNFVTEEYERELSFPPATDEIAKRYLWQDVAVQGIYDCYRQLGKTIEEAFIATLRVCVGENPDIPW